MKFSKININNLPFEDIHNIKNTRKTLATKETTGSKYIDAITKGILPSGHVYDWHTHENTVEIGIVIKGTGKAYCESEVFDYGAEDVIIIPANSNHKWEANTDSEYFFIRVSI